MNHKDISLSHNRGLKVPELTNWLSEGVRGPAGSLCLTLSLPRACWVLALGLGPPGCNVVTFLISSPAFNRRKVKIQDLLTCLYSLRREKVPEENFNRLPLKSFWPELGQKLIPRSLTGTEAWGHCDSQE